jgi:hypothetical protein
MCPSASASSVSEIYSSSAKSNSGSSSKLLGSTSSVGFYLAACSLNFLSNASIHANTFFFVGYS